MAAPHDESLTEDAASIQEPTVDRWRELKSTPLTFSGTTGEYFQLWLVNLALVIASCGVYIPWARVRSRQYFLGQTRLDGSGFEYRVNPRALLLGWFVIGIGLSLMGTFSDLLASALASAFLPLGRREWMVVLLSLSFGLLLQWVGVSWLIVQSMRYNASRTVFRNLHFGFGSQQEHRRLWRELMRLLALSALTVPSLGLLWPYFSWRWRRFQIGHRRFGSTPFTFHATPAEFWNLHRRALPLLLLALAAPAPAIGLLAAYGESARWIAPLALLLLLALGMAFLLGTLWSCWLEAAAARLTWRSIRLGPLRFHCTWAVAELLKLRLTNSMALVFSLGLAWPWVRIRTSRYRLEGILVSPAGALESFLAGEAEQVSALAEGGLGLEDSLAGLIDISF
ncbi:MAG: YjgN family protein [Cyanobium sp.]